MRSKIIGFITVLSAAFVAVVGTFAAKGRGYAYVSLVMAVLCCVPFFVNFEKKRTSPRFLVLVSIMTAASVAGRFLFAPVPFFKPVTAVVIVTAIALGPQAGFVTGAMSALVSNFYFSHGPWTPFQMLAWGLIGFGGGILSDKLGKNKILLSAYGIVSGVLYSLVMDLWSVLWIDGRLVVGRFAALFVSSLPVTLCYAASNVIFLLLIGKPIGSALSRIIKKYGIFEKTDKSC